MTIKKAQDYSAIEEIKAAHNRILEELEAAGLRLKENEEIASSTRNHIGRLTRLAAEYESIIERESA